MISLNLRAKIKKKGDSYIPFSFFLREKKKHTEVKIYNLSPNKSVLSCLPSSTILKNEKNYNWAFLCLFESKKICFAYIIPQVLKLNTGESLYGKKRSEAFSKQKIKKEKTGSKIKKKY